jgi:hypothetical protein
MATLDEVYGVTSRQVLSYVERNDVDDSFKEALESGKQIIVYGSSKQGKTAVVSKYLPYDDHILVSLTPRTRLVDIYQAVLNKAGVRMSVSTTERTSTESTGSITAKFKASIPFLGGGEAGAQAERKAGAGQEQKFEEVPINLELPQSVSELLARVGCRRWVILENFHYLPDEVQRQFAFDLRAFQELGVRFVILGVWREKNRMAQFNGDLLDRTIEVPVEPWIAEDFRRVVYKGAGVLNVSFDEALIEEAIDASFSSIGVFQELIKIICGRAGVLQTREKMVHLADQELLAQAIRVKTNDYAARHQRALEAIAAGHASGGAKGDLPPLYLPYYLVRTILEHGFDGISHGARRSAIH